MKIRLFTLFFVLFTNSFHYATDYEFNTDSNKTSYEEYTEISTCDKESSLEIDIYVNENDDNTSAKITQNGSMLYNEIGTILEQLSAEDQSKVKDAVVEYNFEKARIQLKFRPAINYSFYKRDVAKLALAELAASTNETPESVKQIQTQISKIKTAEQEIINTRASENQAIEAVQKKLRNKITKIVNRWLMKSIKLTEDEIVEVIEFADKKYGQNS